MMKGMRSMMFLPDSEYIHLFRFNMRDPVTVRDSNEICCKKPTPLSHDSEADSSFDVDNLIESMVITPRKTKTKTKTKIDTAMSPERTSASPPTSMVEIMSEEEGLCSDLLKNVIFIGDAEVSEGKNRVKKTMTPSVACRTPVWRSWMSSLYCGGIFWRQGSTG
jgi:hypothetical protein